MMVANIHFFFNVITDFIYQIYFKKWFSSDKIPYDTFILEFIFMTKNVVYSLFCNLPCHSFFTILSDEITIFTSQLTIFSNNKCYGFFHFDSYIY